MKEREDLEAVEGLSSRHETPLRRFLRRFRGQPVAVSALCVLLAIMLAALLAPVLAPYDPNATDLSQILLSPGENGHVLGTDHLGRDVLSRLLFAGRVSLVAATLAVAVGAVLGILPALVAGYLGGRFDWAAMRVADSLLAFPPLILAITVIGILGPGLTNAMIAVGIIFAPRFARIARGATLSVRQDVYVEAARSMGLGQIWILWKHVLPHVLSPILVTGTVLAGMAMIIEAGLSFIGLGVQVPQASWGSMLATSYRFIAVAPSLIWWPGLAVVVTVLATNLLGDGIHDALGRERRPTTS